MRNTGTYIGLPVATVGSYTPTRNAAIQKQDRLEKCSVIDSERSATSVYATGSFQRKGASVACGTILLDGIASSQRV